MVPKNVGIILLMSVQRISCLSIIFPDELRMKKLDYCLNKNKMPFDGGINGFECYKVLEKGPCETGEWLVLDQNNSENESSPHAKCEEKPCDGNDQWLSTETGKCRNIFDSLNCTDNSVEPILNPYGVGKFKRAHRGSKQQKPTKNKLT